MELYSYKPHMDGSYYYVIKLGDNSIGPYFNLHNKEYRKYYNMRYLKHSTALFIGEERYYKLLLRGTEEEIERYIKNLEIMIELEK